MTHSENHITNYKNIALRGTYILNVCNCVTVKWQRKRISDYCQKHNLSRFIANNYYEYEHLLL